MQTPTALYHDDPQRRQFCRAARKIVFTGMIDQFFDYRFGALDCLLTPLPPITVDKSKFEIVVAKFHVAWIFEFFWWNVFLGDAAR